MRRVSVRMGRNFSPARKVLSSTAPSLERLSLVRTNAPPLPGFTCWNSTILKTVPSTSMWVPFLNWLVLITRLRLAGGLLRHDAGQPSPHRRCDSVEVRLEAVVSRHGDHLSGGTGGRHAERVTVALHHERRHRHRVELGQARLVRTA